MSPQGSLAVGERVYLRRIRASDRDEFLDGAIVGQFTLSQIFDGPFRNAYLGYSHSFHPPVRGTCARRSR